MHSYIAFAWDEDDLEATHIASTLIKRLRSLSEAWEAALVSRGLHVYHSFATSTANRAYPLEQGAGVVLGRVFRRQTKFSSTPVGNRFDATEAMRLVRTDGRHLASHYWGSYVAILRTDSGTTVIRDPSGAMRCLSTTFQRIAIVFSDPLDCIALGLLKPAIDWDHIAAYLWYDRFITSHTGLVEVSEVRPGERLSLTKHGAERAFCWSPMDICRLGTIDDRKHASQELKACIEQCIAACASCYTRILHRLSGGLDSAVVLASLRSVGAEVVCANHFTPFAEGDERPFARQVASAAGVELVELPLGVSELPLSAMLDSTLVASPGHTNLLPESHSAIERLIESRGIQAVFSGQGGDHLFQRMATIHIAAEYAWRHGLRPQLLEVVAETARFTRQPIWTVFAASIVYGLLRGKTKGPYERLAPSPLLSPEARAGVRLNQLRHPWLTDAQCLPGSKLLQIANVVDAQHYYQMSRRYADLVHPLLCQPIVELSLQIPTYVLTFGGIDRALLRNAFSDSIPADIIRRTSKGATTGHFHGLLLRDLTFVRELLLGGNLVAQGLLDRTATERALQETSIVKNPNLLWPLLNAIRAEAWVRTWTGSAKRAAA